MGIFVKTATSATALSIYNHQSAWMKTSSGATQLWQNFKMPTYTGTYAIFGNKDKGRIELYTSGNLTVSKGVYDVFLVGGGTSGSSRGSTGNAAGGSSGKTKMNKSISVKAGIYPVVIGAGGASSSSSTSTISYGKAGGSTSVFDISVAGGTAQSRTSGGTGGSGGGAGGTNDYDGEGGGECPGGNGGSNGSNGSWGNGEYAGTGQKTTTRAFEETSGVLYAGGGGGSGPIGYGTGGTGGGGKAPGSSGAANTGGGGGAGNRGASGTGGSGLVIVRWGY